MRFEGVGKVERGAMTMLREVKRERAGRKMGGESIQPPTELIESCRLRA
jgi:hypothetical protein